MSLLQLAIIALLQGTTEWLPVSSSGHVLLAADFFQASPADELLINAVSNLGTLLAMLIYFRKDVLSAIGGGFELIAAPVSKAPLSRGARLAAAVIVATPVAVLVAFAYEKFLPEHMLEGMRSIYVVAATTILFGALLWWADVKGDRDRKEAARFSMLIGAPILAAAGLYGAMGLLTADAAETVLTIKDGLIVAGIAFVTGLASIWFLMSLLSRMSFLPFVLYRFVLGAVLILGSPLVGLL